MYDVIIIGAGVSGAACARELGRYDARVLVLEREEDVCCGTSKANSAIVHAGFDAPHGSLMAKLNVEGSRVMEALSKELDFSYSRCGSLVLCMAEEDLPKLRALYENGLKNGVEGLRIIGAEELHALEPNVSEEAVAALWAPTGAILCPFEFNQALAENAAANGVEFIFNSEITGIERTAGGYLVRAAAQSFETRVVINAAGVRADGIHRMVSAEPMDITPTRGDYMLLDKEASGTVTHTLFTLPGAKGKGVLISPTVHGNTIVGPTSIPTADPEATATTAEGLEELSQKAKRMVPALPLWQVITSFAGLRAKEKGHEFIIGEPSDAPGFIDCAGIESPGLSAAPAVGRVASEIAVKLLGLKKKEAVVSARQGILRPASLTVEERAALVEREPAYGQIVCRCEGITEGEILDAIRRSPGAKSLDGVKRRVRAGMGRCQGGFCAPRVMEILARELSTPLQSITKAGPGSEMAVGLTKEGQV